LDEGRLEIQRIAYQQIQETASQAADQILQQGLDSQNRSGRLFNPFLSGATEHLTPEVNAVVGTHLGRRQASVLRPKVKELFTFASDPLRELPLLPVIHLKPLLQILWTNPCVASVTRL
jgi:hypothetical protein